MIPYNMTQVYDWDDIERYLCTVLDIHQDKFRDYHKIIGGTYKDLWHVWLTLHDNIQNDSIIRHWKMCNADGWRRAVTEYGNWVLTVKPAFDSIYEAVGDGIWVHYSW